MGMAFPPWKLMPRSEAGTEGESQSNKDQFYIFNDCNELGGFKITVCRLMMAVPFFLLEYNCFTRLCSCLQHKQVNQLYVYVYPRPLGPPHHSYPTPLGHHRTPSFPLAVYFTHGRVHVLVLISQAVPPSSPLPVSMCPFFTSGSLFPPCR